jgi:hypothetical protein
MLTNFFAVRRVKEGTNRASLDSEGQQWTAGRRERKGGVVEGGKADGLLTRQNVAATDSSDSFSETDLAASGKTEREGGREFWKGLVVQTASLEEGVLPGVIRQKVLR